MLRNYIKTAWKNLFKNKFYSLINIAGLTTGLAVGILMLLWVQDETSFDSFHSQTENIYRVNSPGGTGVNRQVWNTTQAPVATYAMKEVPGVKSAVRLTPKYSSVFGYKERLLQEENNGYTDPSFFRLFDFKLLKGDISNPFPNDQSVILTESAARRYFGDENPIGKQLLEDHKNYYTVSGVIADFPDNSSIKYDMLFPINLIARQYSETDFWKSLDNDWGNFGYTTFLELQPGTSLKKVGEQLISIQMRHATHLVVSVKDNAYQLQPLKDIHLTSADGKDAGLQKVRIFLLTAVLLLLIACINYVNLSTARAIARAKEVSIRKISGAAKSQLFFQFITESILFFLISLVGALILMLLLTPAYNYLTGKHLALNLLNASVWKVIGIAMSASLFASSIYPAILLSSFEPLQSLKGKLMPGIGSATFRKVLVTVQFVFSLTLIIATVVIGRQLRFIREKDPGYERSQVFSFRAGEMKKHFSAVKAILENATGVEAVTSSANKVENNINTTGGVNWDGKDPNAGFIMHTMGVDEDFLPILKMKLVAGNNFTGSISDSTHFILNETAVKMTGIKDPIGNRFKYQRTEGTIIGVVRDFNFASLKEQIGPLVIFYEPAGRYLYVKTTGRNAASAVAAAERVWNEYNPGFPFQYHFLDEAWGKLYSSDELTGSLFNAFSIIAIFISCLGLFGLATYTAQTMTKQIGIRKVLGASVASIVTLLSKDFLKLVAIAIIIASPIAWIAMHSWLENFAYRIDLSVWLFVFSAAVIIFIAVFTISFQSIKAAVANPIKSLRNE